MNNCTDSKCRAFKIIEGLRGKAMEYFDALPRFDENEPGLSLRSKLYQVAQKRGKP